MKEIVFQICYGCMSDMENGQKICSKCGHDNSVKNNREDELPEGTILEGHFLVGRVLGRGGFGITYLGYDINLRKKVAIKEFYPSGYCTRISQKYHVSSIERGEEGSVFENGIEAFLGEAQSLARFNTPYIVHVIEFFHENGTAYIVMDYLEGETLKAVMKQNGGRLPPERVLGLMKPIIRELGYLHKNNMIHRDIKPANLMLVHDREGEHLALLDFGSARNVVSDVTGDYSTIVSYGFSPKEQYKRHSRQGPYTDVYALCATIYNAITGTIPPESIEREKNEPIDSFFTHGVSVPKTVEGAIMRGLAVEIEDRTQTMEQLLREMYPEPEKLYKFALRLMNEAKDDNSKKDKIDSYKSAIAVFKRIEGYKDSHEKLDECEREIRGLQSKPKIFFITIGAIIAFVIVIGMLVYRGIERPYAAEGDKNSDNVRSIQKMLSVYGYYDGELSGDFDSKTTEAVSNMFKASDRDLNYQRNKVIITSEDSKWIMQYTIPTPTPDVKSMIEVSGSGVYIVSGENKSSVDGNSLYLDKLADGEFYSPGISLKNVSDTDIKIQVKLVEDGIINNTWEEMHFHKDEPWLFWLNKNNSGEVITVGTHKYEWYVYDELITTYELTVSESDPASAVKSVSIGDYITFGSYEQDNNLSNGKEDIEWLVLDKDGDSIFVISRYALDSQLFDQNRKNIWETCSLREWLNSTFINTAFTQSEQSKIQSTTIKSESGGNDTVDKVFLLSYSEARKYFNTEKARQRQGTAYCYAQGAYKYNNGNCRWWLRSPVSSNDYDAGCVSGGGVWGGLNVVSSGAGVSPTMWINLGS